MPIYIGLLAGSKQNSVPGEGTKEAFDMPNAPKPFTFDEILSGIQQEGKTELERAAERNAPMLAAHGARLKEYGVHFVWNKDSGYQRFSLQCVVVGSVHVAVSGCLVIEPAKHRRGSLSKANEEARAVEQFLQQFGWRPLGWIDVGENREAYEMVHRLNGCFAVVELYGRPRRPRRS